MNASREKHDRKLVGTGCFAFDCSGMVNAISLWDWNGYTYHYLDWQDGNQDEVLKRCISVSITAAIRKPVHTLLR